MVNNYAKWGRWQHRGALFGVAVSRRTLKLRLESALDYVCRKGGVFHLWGHSWEFERFGGWGALDEFLRFARERIPREDRVCNSALLDRLEAFPSQGSPVSVNTPS